VRGGVPLVPGETEAKWIARGDSDRPADLAAEVGKERRLGDTQARVGPANGSVQLVVGERADVIQDRLA